MLVKKFLKNDVTVDVGSAHTVIAVGGEGVVLNEPTVLAYRPMGPDAAETVAVGQAAKQMLGRAPEGIQVARPIRHGVIDNFSLTRLLLKTYADRVLPKGMLRKSCRVAMVVPCQATQVDRRALREAALSLGISEVYLMEKPLASAVGSGLAVSDADGCMVIDVGAGLTEMGVLSLGGVVVQRSLTAAGDHMEALIVQHVRKEHGLLIGEPTAERVKLALASALPLAQPRTLEVTGHKMSEGVPRTITLTSQEIGVAVAESVQAIVSAVQHCLAQCPPELAEGLTERGLMLCGQGALLEGLGPLLSQKTGLSVGFAPEPGLAAALGAAEILSRSARAPAMALQEE